MISYRAGLFYPEYPSDLRQGFLNTEIYRWRVLFRHSNLEELNLTKPWRKQLGGSTLNIFIYLPIILFMYRSYPAIAG